MNRSLYRGLSQSLKIVSVSFLVLIFSFAFQNCGSQIDNNSLISTKPGPVVLQGETLNKVPFAFDNIINEIAYMSCSHSDRPKADKSHMSNPSFFTFKAQASGSNSGIGLRQEFKDYLIKNFGNSNYQVADDIISSALVDAPANAFTSLQFAVRPMSDPVQQVKNLHSPDWTPQFGSDYNFFLSQNSAYASLTYNQNLLQIKDLFSEPSTTRINNFLEQGSNHTMDSSVNFHLYDTFNEFAAKNMRDTFSAGQNTNILAVTYTNDLRIPENQKNVYYSRPTNTDPNNKSLIWGKGYKLSFTVNPRVGGVGYSNVLNTINEIDLSKGISPTGDRWDCSKISYLIISPYDNDPTSGTTTTFPAANSGGLDFTRCQEPVNGFGGNLNASQQAELALMQRYLPSTDWIIDPINKCVVPKKNAGDCYANRNPGGENRQIQYKYDGLSGNCGSLNQTSTKDCPEFVSICTRISNN